MCVKSGEGELPELCTHVGEIAEGLHFSFHEAGDADFLSSVLPHRQPERYPRVLWITEDNDT